MTISYNWLNNYLPEKIEPGKLSEILTSIGLEVESLEIFENFKGALKGLVTGEVISCEPHPNADKLKVTKVDINNGEPLQIVCGAPNVAAGQKVIVAPVGVTIYPLSGNAITMKVAKIRGVESFGMICAEDEIGLSEDHGGIMVLPADTAKGKPVAELFNVYSDWIYEIGLTPNRMDAMSHIGVAKDVCAWLSHHQNNSFKPLLPFKNNVESSTTANEFEVVIENKKDCRRYAGIVIKDVTVKESPVWLQNFLKAIGQRPINNIVDITNFILHETGQPLHAFDADALTSKKIVIKNLPEGTLFTTLDEVERKLSDTDLMICNGDEPVCIAGVFGGLYSGVTSETKNVFLESAWFNPSSIRRTSMKYGLRTEAAVRFEKGVDISGTVPSLVRAAQLISAIAGGTIQGNAIDIYPTPFEKKIVSVSFNYIKKLSGKYYAPVVIKHILLALEFDILEENETSIKVAVPFSKADITMPADIVEEVIRIDGLNNITIPSSVTITPSVQENMLAGQVKEKLAQMLAGLGFNEIVTNSIGNSKNYSEVKLSTAVRLLNNLSAELDIMRPSMIETGLEILAYNINRKNNNLRFFELGKIYNKTKDGYNETEKICFWITKKQAAANWKHLVNEPDFYTAKGILSALAQNMNVTGTSWGEPQASGSGTFQTILTNKSELGTVLQVSDTLLQKFGIKQSVIYAEADIAALVDASQKADILYTEIPQFPVVERDLSIILQKRVKYNDVTAALGQLHLKLLQHYNLFDVYEGDRIDSNKKSFAINFKFISPEKTLTDTEVEAEMKIITNKLVSDFAAEIRQ